MSLSDRFKSFVKKNSESPSSNKKEKPETPAEPPKAEAAGPNAEPAPIPTPPSHTLEDLGRLISQERGEGEAKKQAMDKELHGIRASLEKMEVAAKTSRETQNQTLQFLQQDAEREIKFFERKLHEDMTRWDKQLKEREKSIEQALRQGEAGHQEKKSASEESEGAGREAADRAEALLKEQETKLLEERQRWRDLLQSKENELLTLKQDLARREADLDQELKQQETQRKAAQELWQTRLKELERQWADKRKTWEEAMKAKEDERLRLHSSFQEKQASWQLEQERRLQDVSRRQERAQEKLAALKAHLVKETQHWQQLSQTREEQVQQLKVKLLLSESEAKGQLDQSQKKFQDSVGQITGQIQILQRQLQQEQDTWQKHLETKDQELRGLKDEVHSKLRHMEADFSQRLTVLNSEKETLNAELQNLQAEYQDAQARHTQQTAKMKEDQASLESDHAQRMSTLKQMGDSETTALQTQFQALEKHKADAERELEAVRLRWQEDLTAKEQALKEALAAVAPQEAEMRKRFLTDEEAVTRQVDALKVRVRALDRDLARTRENLEKADKEQAAVRNALENDFRTKEELLQQRSGEQVARLQKRLEERRMALDAFLVMKKDEETRVQTTLRDKEKERAELSTRLETLPHELDAALQEKKLSVQKESEQLRGRITALEAELAQSREDSKTIIQGKATQLAALRQSLELAHKEVTSTIRSREQVLESERAQIEKQITAGQAEMDRVRSHWQDEIDKKEKEISALQEELRKQETLQRQTLEAERKAFDEQLQPLEKERAALGAALEEFRTQHEDALKTLETEKTQCQQRIQQVIEKERSDKSAMETRMREERAQWKAKVSALSSEREGVLQSGHRTVAEKTKQIEQMEEQLRAQTVAHETRRRDLIHQATLKSRTLQDILHQIELELKTIQDLAPRQLEEREGLITKLQEDLIAAQAKHQRTLARYERALSTLERRGRQKEETLSIALRAVQEEWAKKLADQDAGIAALQSNLLGKEAERQGELDRLAKQFAEERFQLEKSKDELEWKLKDRKEVAERQLAARQKEVQALENEIHRVKTQRDQDVAQKDAAFEAEKLKLQTTLSFLQKQIDDTRQTQEAALSAKEQELQALLARSKEHLRALSEEFNQKVGSWRATNDSLRGHIDQLKGHVVQAQDHWEALRKEKANEVTALRQELAQREAQTKNEAEEFERSFSEQRQSLTGEVRLHEKSLQEMISDFEHRLAAQDDEMARATDEIRSHEQNTEAQWHASLEQWETDKQALQQQKMHLEQELVSMQNQFQAELRHTEDAMAKLTMEIAFKEAHASGQKEKMQSQMQRDLDPLRDRLARLTSEEESERTAWDIRLRAKDDELKMLKARLGLREKRLQEESRRRAGEIDKLRKQVAQEVETVRGHYEAERTQLEKILLERRETLARLQASENGYRQNAVEANAELLQAAERERQQLEESLKQILAQREQLRERYEALMADRDATAETLNRTLEAREQELDALRDNAKEQAGVMRKKMEALRQVNRRHALKQAPASAGVWGAFEAGVNFYQSQQWAEAARAFEDCLQKDPQWGAAYQYLALTYHAQGFAAKAAEVAARAKELDPGNTQLSTWVDRLNLTIRDQKAS